VTPLTSYSYTVADGRGVILERVFQCRRSRVSSHYSNKDVDIDAEETNKDY